MPLTLALYGPGRGRDRLHCFPLLPAPSCGRYEVCCWGHAGEEVEAAGERPRRRATRAGFLVWSPPFASVRWRTGPCSPPRHQRGLPGRSGSRINGACRIPSNLPGSATGGAPGPPEWTSSDQGTTPWLSSPEGQGPSPCAAPASNLGQNCPCAAASMLWPGRLVEGPWHAGLRWTV